MARRWDAENRFQRFVAKNNVEMKECLQPLLELSKGNKNDFLSGKEVTLKEKDMKCYCGEQFSKHYYPPHREWAKDVKDWQKYSLTKEELEKDKESLKKKWGSAIRQLPTNAAGKINFIQEDGVKRVSDFIRISDTTSMKVVADLFRKHWSLYTPPPSLVISIIGGAKNLKMDSKVKETVKSGLVMAAKSTNAWLLTGAFNMGVMKLVGDAVAEWQGVQFDDNGQPREAVRCIGIAPWGYVRNREKLTIDVPEGNGENRSANNSGKRVGGVFDYEASSTIEHNQCPSLNPHHTHFLLVDNGKRTSFGKTSAEVNNFRAEFEKTVSENDTAFGSPIPVVVVLVEGGDESFEGIATSIEKKIPVVCCDGTGRAAYILAYAIGNHYVEAAPEISLSTHSQETGPRRDHHKDDRYLRINFTEVHKTHLKDKIYRAYYDKFFTKFEANPPNFRGNTEAERLKHEKDMETSMTLVKSKDKVTKSGDIPHRLRLEYLPDCLKEFCMDQIEKILVNVKKCCVDKALLTAFDCRSDKEDFDYAILAALAKKKRKISFSK